MRFVNNANVGNIARLQNKQAWNFAQTQELLLVEQNDGIIPY